MTTRRTAYSIVPNVAEYDDDDNDSLVFKRATSCLSPPSRRILWLVFGSLGLCSLGLLRMWWTRLTSKEGAYVGHHEMIPTLLSVVGTDNEFLYALDNPLYDDLQQSVFHNLVESKSSINTINMVDVFPEILVSVENERIVTDDDSTSQGQTSQLQRTSMTLSWTKGLDKKGHPVVQDEDVIVLRCGTSDDERRAVPTDALPIVEAATIAQARATHLLHNRDRSSGDASGTNIWTTAKLPSFLLRQSSVSFCCTKKCGFWSMPLSLPY
jgi:hypothetical protein